MVARGRERRLHGGRAGPGKTLGGRPQGGGEGIVGNLGIGTLGFGIIDPVQPEELPHRHGAEADRLRVGQHLPEPHDALHRMRRHTTYRVPRHDAGLAPDGGEFGPTEDPPQPVDAGHVGVNHVTREPVSRHTARVGGAMDHRSGVPSAARSCGFPTAPPGVCVKVRTFAPDGEHPWVGLIGTEPVCATAPGGAAKGRISWI